MRALAPRTDCRETGSSNRSTASANKRIRFVDAFVGKVIQFIHHFTFRFERGFSNEVQINEDVGHRLLGILPGPFEAVVVDEHPQVAFRERSDRILI